MKRVRLLGAWLLALVCLFAQEVKAQGIWVERGQIAVQTGGHWHELGEQALAWSWDRHFPGQRGLAQITLDFDRHSPDLQGAKALALVGVALGNRYRYSLNGSNWHEFGWEKANTHSRPSPQILRFHYPELSDGANRLVIQIRAEPANESGFSRMRIDWEDRAQVFHQEVRDVRMLSVVVVAAICVFTGLMALTMWGVHRGGAFIFLGLAEFCFATRQLATLVEHPPLPTWVWNALMALGFALYVGFVCRASWYLMKNPPAWLAKAGIAYLWGSVLVLWAGFAWDVAEAYRAWAVVMLLITLAHLSALVRDAWSGADPAPKLFAVAGFIALVLGAWDFVTIRLLPDGLGRWRMATYGSIFFNLALTWIVVQRYAQAQRELALAEAKSLEQAELAKRDERHRIMAELHDSVGAQLVGIQSMLKTQQPHEAVGLQVNTALDQLRMTVDALQPVHGRLEVVLASLRHRLQPRIAGAGLKLLWRVDQMPVVEDLSPQKIQHIQRIINEAVTNVIRHADASTLEIAARYESGNSPGQGRFIIGVTDDGEGMGPDASQGQGLRNMQMRAQILGATLSVEPVASGGVRVELALPEA